MEQVDRVNLKRELTDFRKNGVLLTIGGKAVEPGDRLVDLLLSEKGCTYMRNYVYTNSGISEIQFQKIKI